MYNNFILLERCSFLRKLFTKVVGNSASKIEIKQKIEFKERLYICFHLRWGKREKKRKSSSLHPSEIEIVWYENIGNFWMNGINGFISFVFTKKAEQFATTLFSKLHMEFQ